MSSRVKALAQAGRVVWRDFIDTLLAAKRRVFVQDTAR